MKKVLVPLAPGFEEIETITVVDILRRAGAQVVLAATEEGPIEGSRGVCVVPDTLIDQVDDRDFDLVVLPGGQPGTANLKKHHQKYASVQKTGGRYLCRPDRSPVRRDPEKCCGHIAPLGPGPVARNRLFGGTGSGGWSDHYQPEPRNGPRIRPKTSGNPVRQGTDGQREQRGHGPVITPPAPPIT